MPTNETPTLLDVMNLAIDRKLDGVFTAFPAKVLSYTVSSQKCDADPQIHDTYINAAGERVSEPLPILAGIPMMFPRGGGFGLTLPVTAGDYVLIVCTQYSLDLWLEGAQKGDPGNLTEFSLAGAIAIPGIFPNKDALTDLADGSNMKMGQDGGMQVTITPSQVEIGGNSDAAALASKVDALIAAFDSHVHPGVTAGGASTSPPPVGVGGTSASTILKIDS